MVMVQMLKKLLTNIYRFQILLHMKKPLQCFCVFWITHNDGDVPYDNLKLYSSQGGYIQCTEYRWETFETEVEQNEETYVIDIVRERFLYTDDDDREANVEIIKSLLNL
mgnify:CR=1 FL=1